MTTYNETDRDEMDVFSSRDEDLARAFAETLQIASVSNGDLARRIGVNKSSIGRWAAGERALTSSVVARVEHALGITKGTIYRRAGAIDDDLDTRSTILTDPNLDPTAAFLLSQLYERLRRAT